MTLLFLTLIILLSILIKLPYLEVPLDADYGIYGYHGLFWLRKQKMPVKDTKENHPPGRWMLYALLLKFFPVSRQIFRISGIFFLTITQISVFIITNHFFGDAYALAAALGFGILVSLPTFVWVQSNDEIEQIAFTSLAIALICLSNGLGVWFFLLIGLITFGSLFFKQSAYVNTYPPVFFAIALINFSILNMSFWIIGNVIGLVLVGIFHHKHQMFHFFLDIFSLNPKAFKMHLDNIFYGNKKLFHYKEYEGDIPPENKSYIDQENSGFKTRQKQWAKNLYGKFFRQSFIYIIFIPLALFLPMDSNTYLFAGLIFIWLVFSAFAIYINKHIMPYHFLPLAAPLAIFSTVSLSGFVVFCFSNQIFLLLLVLPVVGICIYIARNELREIRTREKVQTGLMYINHPNEWLFFTIGEEIGKSLKESTTIEDRIFVWGAQYEIYLWAERPSPTWSLFCPHPSVAGHVPTPFLDEDLILRDVVPSPPKYIIIAANTRGFDRFRDFLKENYYAIQGKEDEVQIFRWIYGDILPDNDEEAKARKDDYSKMDSFKSDENNRKIKTLSADNIAELNKILAINPFHEDTNQKLVTQYFERGDVNGIMRSLHYLLMANAKNTYVAKTLGKICILNNKFSQGEKLYRQGLKYHSEDSESLKQLALALVHQNELNEAKDLFENYLVQFPTDMEALEKIMEIHFIMGRRGEAKYFGEKISERNPVSTEIFQKINQVTQNQLSFVDRPNREINIVWEGSQFVNHSLALVNREHSVRLLERGFNVSIIPYEKSQFDPDVRYKVIKEAERKALPSVDIHLRHQWPPNLNPPKLGHWVVIQPWEFGYLPEKWVEVFNAEVDEMWVPSTYVKNVYVDSGIDCERVFVVPNGVDSTKFHPNVPPYPLKTKKKFKFLFVGGTIYRKGIDLLLKAYTKIFSKQDDVCLVIKDFGGKSFYKNQTFKAEISGIINDKKNPEIEYINEVLDEQDLIGLYTACDVLVHPYRGEGFGLPILEAMACGKPTIITNGGAAKDFCNSKTSLFVKANKISHETDSIGDKKLVDNPWFWECDIKDMAIKMKYATENPDVLQQMGEFSAKYTKSNWDWNLVNMVLQNRIQKIVKKPVYRFQKDFRKLIQEMDQSQENQQMLTNFQSRRILPLNRFGEFICAKNLHQEKFLKKNISKIEQIFPDNPGVMNILGITQFELGNIDAAVELLSRSLMINENSLDTRRNLAELLILKEDYQNGLQQFQEVIKQNPRDIPALTRMAEFSIETKRYKDAEDYINAILKADSENKVAMELKSLLNN